MLLMSLSCSKSDDDAVVTPLNDFGVQYKTDIDNIELYLETHYLDTSTDYAAEVNRADLIKEIPTNGNQPSLKSLETSTTYPKLLFKEVTVDSHNSTKYKIYYLVFNEGNVTEKPCVLDDLLVTYRGTALEKTSEGVVSAKEFTNIPISSKLTLSSTIGGWQEIFPLFGNGTFDEVATGNGPNVYTNYGAGIMFLPSGLGYFNGTGPTGSIKAYSPLVFSFQLLNFLRADNDNDGILSVDEIVRNTDNTFTYTDTDGDGAPDYRDLDDDNDGYTTRNETKYINSSDPLSEVHYYPFNGTSTDDPNTLWVDERQGIPSCSNDFTTPTRKRKHLDNTCH